MDFLFFLLFCYLFPHWCVFRSCIQYIMYDWRGRISSHHIISKIWYVFIFYDFHFASFDMFKVSFFHYKHRKNIRILLCWVYNFSNWDALSANSSRLISFMTLLVCKFVILSGMFNVAIGFHCLCWLGVRKVERDERAAANLFCVTFFFSFRCQCCRVGVVREEHFVEHFVPCQSPTTSTFCSALSVCQLGRKRKEVYSSLIIINF